MFKWVLTYHHPGYSYIDMTETVPIRPFRHNEYERFIQQVRGDNYFLKQCQVENSG